MPYVNEHPGLYTITCNPVGRYYVGSSAHVLKRTQEHKRLLRLGTHPNSSLQTLFNDYGEDKFDVTVEVSCSDINELRYLEQQCLNGEMWFNHGDKNNLLNIASNIKGVMTRRKHSAETKALFSKMRKGKTDHITDEYRKKLSEAQEARYLSDSKFLAKVRYIVNNPSMSYAARARHLGVDTSNVRRLYLRYKDRSNLL